MRRLTPILTVLAACSLSAEAPMELENADYAYSEEEPAPMKQEARASSAPSAEPVDALDDAGGGDGIFSSAAELGGAKNARSDQDAEKPQPDDDSTEPGRTRAWFPETFLWEPLVETGPDGVAEIPVRVPDRLTSWRVLGLAHSEHGQAGSVHTFASVQDVYVDPVVPGHLYGGDRIALPVQSVNTSRTARDAVLSVEGSASLSGGGGGALKLLPGGTVLRTVSIDAPYAGQGMVQARLGTLDSVVRQVSVRPVGKPHLAVAGGSVTDVRSFSLPGPKGADPATQELVVQVYPGGLAVLQAELDRVGGGGSVADPAYGFAVTSVLGDLSAAAGVEVDDEAVRRVRQQSWQRLIRSAGLDPQPDRLVWLVGALREVEGHELAVERRDLWARRLVEAQRADGTWAPGDSGTLQALIVQTATAAWVLPEDEAYDTARAKAASAIERLARQVDDPYTAAVVVASGLVDGELERTLVAEVLEGVRERSDGSRTVRGAGSVHSGFGGMASHAETLAWTRLALASRDDLPWRDDLVAELMAGYGARGFGAGRADLVALVAVADALPQVTSPVDVVLLKDDEEVARATLDPSQPRDPVSLAAVPGGEDPSYTLKIDGSAPGLAWTARLRSYTPWESPRNTGVEASFAPGTLRAGRVSKATLTLAAPGGSRVKAKVGLPAGTWVDLDALRTHPAIASAEQREDTLELQLNALGAAEILELPISVQPAFAGLFSTGPLSLEVRGAGAVDLDLPPPKWRVSL